MIKLKGWQSQYIEVELSKSQVTDSMIDIIRKKHNLTKVDGIDEEGRMFENVEYATSHSWFSKEDRGEATEKQRKALEVIAWLKENR